MLKSYVLLLAGAAVLSPLGLGADFLTGQAARAVIGQPFFNAQNTGAVSTTPGPAGGPRRPRRPSSVQGTPITLLGAASGLAYANNTLFVVDDNHLGLQPEHNRVLTYNGIQQMIPAFDTEIPPNVGRCPVCGGTASVVVGQPDFVTTAAASPVTQSSMRSPTAAASDGKILAVADTSNNRILIWKSIPATNGQPADIVLGQANFTTVAGITITASSLRGPQGVWIQNGKLFVADTENNRVLIWNSIPTQNNQPADVVLGQPDFTTSPPINQVNLTLPATATTMLSPTSVTSDGTRLYVSDLGFNRVLIWNSIPTSIQKPADVEIGQKDFTQSVSNDNTNLCPSDGTDANGNATYPPICGRTLSFPRYALSDGARLFIADGGNDRVLVFNSIPTQNAAKADVILGEPDEVSDVFSTSNPLGISSADVTPTPTSLAWDGQNLYVADATDYRVLIFSPAVPDLPLNSVLNDASLAVFAEASVVVGGTITSGNTATVTIGNTNTAGTAVTVAYNYTILSSDTLDSVAQALTKAINAGNGDPNVLATEEKGFATIHLIARQPGTNGNNITLAVSTSTSATITLTQSGANLQGGGSAAIIAPGTVVVVNGVSLADTSASAPQGAETLPYQLAGVELYFDGIRAGLFSVSPTQIKAHFPFLVTGATSVSAWVRTTHPDGSVTVTTAIGVPVEEQNPGIFADTTPGAPEPRTATAIHTSSFATGTIVFSGGIQVGDAATITIGDSSYSYTVVAADTLVTIVNQFVTQINADPNAPVTASAGGVDFNLRLRAQVPGPDGNGIPITTSVTALNPVSFPAILQLTATNTVLCCASAAGTPITTSNPAIPGETITIFATGLGLVCSSPIVAAYCSVIPDPALSAIVDAAKYRGPAVNAPFIDVNALVGNVSATVISAALQVGQIGIYQIQLEIASTTTPDPQAQLTISQLPNNSFVPNTSNIVVVPIGSPPQQ